MMHPSVRPSQHADHRDFPKSTLRPNISKYLDGFIRNIAARVKFAEEQVERLKGLARQGPILFALKNKSRLNSLLVREMARRMDIPIPLWSMGDPYYLPGLSEANHAPPSLSRDDLAAIFQRQESAVLHLGSSRLINDPAVEDALTELIHLQGRLSAPITIVPLLISYGRRRDIQNESLFNILFGQFDDVGAIRRMITLLRYANKITVISAQPLNLQDYLTENERLSRDELLIQCRGDLIGRIDEEREATVGPVLKSRREFIDLILQDRSFIDYLEALAKRQGKSLPVLLKESSRYLKEIASDYSETFVELWDKLLTWLWKNIYDGVIVDRKGLARVRNISKEMPLVVVPCHRSHIDYLLLSYVFYKQNIQLPFVAAGINLSFWPIGYIFRKSGAFFIRRSFKGLDLYSEVFSRYVRAMLAERMPVEFFIEGGRSRTGKMVMPKYGLLSMILRAFQEGGMNNLGIIPVYIGYDRVVEEKSYIKELEGMPKAGEKTSDVIRSRKVVKKRYGHVYVNIGEPIIFRDYIEKLGVTLNSLDDRERQALYRKISYDIALAINRVSVVTPSALVAAAFLAHDRKGIRHDQWKASLDAFRDYLAYQQAPFAATFQQEDKAIAEAVDIFLREQVISIDNAGKDSTGRREVIYTLPGEKRLLVDYYKNIIIHYFLPLSFLGMSILSRKEDVTFLKSIAEDYGYLKKLFRHEFIFDDERKDDDEVKETLDYLASRGHIVFEERREGSTIMVRGRGKDVLKAFAGLIQTYLESYWLVTRSTAFIEKQAREEKEWLKEIRRMGLKFYQDGEIRRYESLSQQNFQGAIRFLTDAGLISLVEKEARRSYQTCGLPEMLDELRRRIFLYLY
jgi:glycerol-3-phosphate O-acyltransferase